MLIPVGQRPDGVEMVRQQDDGIDPEGPMSLAVEELGPEDGLNHDPIDIIEFAVPTANSNPVGITSGPDGNLWFVEEVGKIGKITTSGIFTEFTVPTANSLPVYITSGPDGNLWFTESDGSKIGRIALDGSITDYPTPTANSRPWEITAGPDGNVWFIERAANKIGQVVINATHFRVAAPTTANAGTSFSITVTALNGFNDTATGYRGTVYFTSSDNAAILPADYTFTAADHGVHTFTGVSLRTAGHRTITATDSVTSSITGSTTVTVTPAAASRLLVSGFPSPTRAGTAGSFMVTAQDLYGNTDTTYTGTVTFTSSDGQAMLPPNYTFSVSDAGMHTFTQGATLTTAGTQSLTATDTQFNIITGSQAGILVTPAALDHFSVATSVDGGSAMAGSPFDVTVTAQDVYDNTVTTYSGTITFSSGDPYGATLPADYTFRPTDLGTAAFSGGVTLYTAGTWDVSVMDTAAGIIGSANVTITPAAAASVLVAGFPSPTNAGAVGVFTVTALDPFGNVATGYTGTVTFSSTDGQAVLPADYTFTSADNGTHAFGAILKTAGTQSPTAADTADGPITGTQDGIIVTPAPADHLQVDAPATVTPGRAFDGTVAALDPYGNFATNYRSTVTFATSDPDPGVVLPADYTFTADDQGVHTFAGGFVLLTEGDHTITATDTAHGVSGSATVAVGSGGGPARGVQTGRQPFRASIEEMGTVFAPADGSAGTTDWEAHRPRRPWFPPASRLEAKPPLDADLVDGYFLAGAADESLPGL